MMNDRDAYEQQKKDQDCDLICRLTQRCADLVADVARLRVENTQAADLIHTISRERDALQAKVDALMLEYCASEMTKEQWDHLYNSTVPVGDSDE